jgi:NADH-quinone oxidoreductase subunit G
MCFNAKMPTINKWQSNNKYFCSEVAGTTVIGNFGRGEKSEIGTYINSFIKTELSGNLVDICPVGALTSKPYSFKARQ